MARGWESKSVESQIEDRERAAPGGVDPSPDDGSKRELDLLEMTRKRLEREIAFASTKRFREMKQRALSHVDLRIQQLNSSKPG